MTHNQRRQTRPARMWMTSGLVVVGLAAASLLLVPALARSEGPNAKRLFELVDDLKARNGVYEKTQREKEPNSEFKKYPAHTFWPGQKLWRLKAKLVAQRETGEFVGCEGETEAIVERAYSFEGFVVRVDIQEDTYYWTAPFESKLLHGLRSGDSKEQTLKLLGTTFKQGDDSMAWACVDGVVAYDGGPMVYYDCLRVFFQDSKVVGAIMVNRQTCG